MSRKISRQRARCAVLAACAMPFFVGRALAGIGFNAANSSVKITHYAERDNAAAFGSKNVVPPPSSGSMPTPGSYAYSKTLNLNSGSSSASAGVGAVTNSQNVGFTFESGTGITQTDPTNSISKAAQLKFVVDGEWDVTAGGFGPTAYGYLAFTLGGSVPAGDSASVDINLSWQDASNNDLRAPINQTIAFPSSTLPYSFSNSAKLNTGSVTGGMIHVTGTISFSALDPGATVTFNPDQMEMSAAPPTWVYTNGSGNGDVNQPEDWRNDMSQDFLSKIPNEPGARAVINSVTEPAGGPIAVDLAWTLGDLDVDQPGRTFSGNAASSLTFETLANDAVLFNRNTHNFSPGAGATTVAVPVILNNSLDVINDSPNPVIFLAPVSDGGSAHGIVKSGFGEMDLETANPFSGGIIINQGSVHADSPGSLGSGSATINGGELDINAVNPFIGTGTISINANSQTNLGNSASGTVFVVNDLGAVEGSAGQLQTLIKGSNYFPAFGSMVGHHTFDTGVSGNPTSLAVGLAGPSYIFGIASDFNSAGGTENITVGSGSGSPWIGFGSDLSPRIFGGGAQFLSIAGQAHLVALGSHLDINAPINGPAGSSIIKRGAGLVSINNLANAFGGSVEVQSGPMAVNGILNSAAITVDSGAALGGTGSIIAAGGIHFQNGSFFKPGLLGNVQTFASDPPTIEGPGTLHLNSTTFSSSTHLVYDLDTAGVAGGASNDLLIINGALTLDGILDVNAGQDFTGGVYTLMTYTGPITDNGLTLGNFDFDNFPGAQIMIVNGAGGGGSVLLAVPEPGTLGVVACLAAGFCMRRRRYE